MIGDRKMKNSKKSSLSVRIVAGAILASLVLGALVGTIIYLVQ